MNKKAIIAIALVAVICIGAGVGFALNRDKKPAAPTTTSSQVTSASVSTTEGESAASTTTTTQAQSTTQEVTEDASKYPFLQQGYWYIYNDAMKNARAFGFKDEDDVDVAFFDEANVTGEDAKYFEGDADYKIVDGNVIITDLPEEIGADTIMFKIDGETLTHGDITLEHYDDLSLEHPFDHFN